MNPPINSKNNWVCLHWKIRSCSSSCWSSVSNSLYMSWCLFGVCFIWHKGVATLHQRNISYMLMILFTAEFGGRLSLFAAK